MKKILLLATFFITLGLSLTAQVRTTKRGTYNQGTTATFPGAQNTTAIPPSSYMDTLQVSDTVAYIVGWNHLNDIGVLHSWYWSKSGAGTAAITLTFLQSNDGLNFTAVPKGAAASAYTKTYALSASGWNYVDFKVDTAYFTGRYLKVQYKTDATASVGGKVYTTEKSYIIGH